MRGLLIVLAATLLSACGFHLRGSYSLPWETLYIGLPEFDEMRASIKRNLEAATQTRVVDEPQSAQASLVILANTTQRNILSLNAKGLVREIQLTRTFAYRIQDAAGKVLMPASHIVVQRDMTFDDERIFAKEAEEAMILREIQNDLVQQLMRRLDAASRNLKL